MADKRNRAEAQEQLAKLHEAKQYAQHILNQDPKAVLPVALTITKAFMQHVDSDMQDIRDELNAPEHP